MTTITVEKIFPMAEGAKSGSLKSADGTIYKFLPWQAKFIRQGETLEVPISESEYEGKIYRWFAKTWPPKDQQNATRTEQPPPRPATNGSTGNGYTNAKDVQIAAIALMKSFIETGSFGLTDLPALEAACIPAARRLVEATK